MTNMMIWNFLAIFLAHVALQVENCLHKNKFLSPKEWDPMLHEKHSSQFGESGNKEY